MTPGLYFSHAACLEHDPRVHSPGHPDTPERLVALERALGERDWLGWARREAPAADESHLELVHTPTHIAGIRELCASGGGAIDADTFVGEPSFRAALHAAGGACEMVRALLAGESAVAFCGVRPSGHHAEAGRAMGFCLFNNVAIAAAEAIAEHGLERVLVLDWDVHAGNGTAEIFRRRADVLFACIHEAGLYPGNGSAERRGQRRRRGLHDQPAGAAGLAGAGVARAAAPRGAPRGRRLPAAARARVGRLRRARRGPAGELRLQSSSFAAMARLVRDRARAWGVPVGVVLEGGYNHEVLADCVCELLPALAGEGEAPAPAAGVEPGSFVERAIAQVGRYWPLRAP